MTEIIFKDEDPGNEAIRTFSSHVQGKTILSVEPDDDTMNKTLVFKFTDGTEACIEIDWLYSLKVGRT